jgi:hypothetical protein
MYSQDSQMLKKLGINIINLSNQQIHDEIMHFIRMERSPYTSWYVGITSNPHTRLFQEHNVDLKESWWVIKKANSVEDARIVVKALIDAYKFDGGNGTADEKSVYIYAYKKTRTTRQ